MTPLATLPCEACGTVGFGVVFVPRTEPDRHDLIGRLSVGVRTRAWCSFDCARKQGWPWLQSERTGRRKAVTQ